MHYIESAIQILKDYTYINSYLLKLHLQIDSLYCQEILEALSKLEYSIQFLVRVEIIRSFDERRFYVKSLHALGTNDYCTISIIQTTSSIQNPKLDINPSSSTTRLNSCSHKKLIDSNSSHKKYPTRKAIGKLNPEIPHQETEIELILRSNTYSNSEEVIESRLDKYLKRKCEFSEPPAKKLKESGQSTIFKYFKRPNP